ncbi:MAG TPA: hypothetical protein VFY23_17060 [Candidatus Limnocylindrales bacterium]|nr:hypothetical protein [Candidatus Limnocylindrales bacterium]
MSRRHPVATIALVALLVAACGDADVPPVAATGVAPEATRADATPSAPATTSAPPTLPEPTADLWFVAGLLMGVHSSTRVLDDSPAWCEPGGAAHGTPLCGVGVNGLAWSPDGRTLAFLVARFDQPQLPDEDVGIWTFTPADRTVRKLAGCGGDLCDTLFSPPAWTDAGASLAHVVGPWERPMLRVLDPADGSLVRERALPSGAALPSPDGRSLAWAGETGIHVSDGSGESRRVSEDAGAVALAWSPDGRSVSYGLTRDEGPVHASTYAWHVNVVELAQERPVVRELDRVPSCCKGGGYASAARFSPDGEWLAFHEHGSLRMIHLDSGDVAPMALDGHRLNWAAPAWRPLP